MRDDSYLESESATILAARKWRNGVITAIGALSSVVIIVAVVTWSYRFTVRDAEDIPVIRAEAGLTKIKPEESGGQVVAHQERTVYDAVTKGGADAPAVETAKLAPPPATLAEEDKVPSKLAPAPQKRPEQAAATETKPDAPAPAEAGVDPLAAAVAAAVAEVVSEEGAEGVEGNAQAPKFAPAARSAPPALIPSPPAPKRRNRAPPLPPARSKFSLVPLTAKPSLNSNGAGSRAGMAISSPGAEG